MTPSFPLLVWPVWRRAVRGRFPRETGYPHSEWTLPLPRWWSPGYWWCALVSRTRCLSPSQTAHPQSGFSGATIRHAGKKSPKVIINLVKLSVIELCNVFMQKTWALKHKRYNQTENIFSFNKLIADFRATWKKNYILLYPPKQNLNTDWEEYKQFSNVALINDTLKNRCPQT